MPGQDDEFLARLRATFFLEAEEHLQAISAGLLELEAQPGSEQSAATVELIYREVHSLKGAARAANVSTVETVCQALESIFAGWKSRVPAPKEFDLMYRATDALRAALSSAPAADSGAFLALVHELNALDGSGGAARNASAGTGKGARGVPPTSGPIAVPPERPAERPAIKTVRIATAKLAAVLLQAEELLLGKLTATQRTAELHELAAVGATWLKQWNRIQREVRQLRTGSFSASAEPSRHPVVLEFLEWNRVWMKSFQEKLAAIAKSAEHDRYELGGVVDTLLEDTKKLLLMPFETVLEPFPRLVRDLSHAQGKEAHFVARGADVEIDKRILEEIKDPLIHMLRNSLDHGVEPPTERLRLGKPLRATVVISVAQVGGSDVEIIVTDDGRGIDIERVKAAAVKRALVSAGAAAQMTRQQASALIFLSALSTSAIITEISGRGLGLAIACEKVEKLGGRISVESDPGKGTTFRIFLPLTLATFKGVLVESAGQRFVIPLANVERVLRILSEQVRSVEHRDTIMVNNQVVPLVGLQWVLGLTHLPGPAQKFIHAVVLGTGAKRIAFRVDAVLNEQEVLVKNLGKPLVRVRNVGGATVLGSGRTVAVLNVEDLMKSAVKAAAASSFALAQEDKEPVKPVSILLAEDSITARVLLKNILESAGYRVSTAVDGAEALSALQRQHFDLLVSDVQMPKMDGFVLTSRIRSDRELAQLPVVLVTALSSPEDRERGIEVGASAYIVKSSFDQSDLQKVISTLL